MGQGLPKFVQKNLMDQSMRKKFVMVCVMCLALAAAIGIVIEYFKH
jgi:hypothetical protein